MRWVISLSLIFAVETLNASPVAERYKVIGILGGQHPVIVLRDVELVKTFFLKSGESIPSSPEYVARILSNSKVMLTASSQKVVLDYQDGTARSPEMKKLVKKIKRSDTENKNLEDYYEKYLKTAGIGIDKDPHDFSKSLLEIPGDEVTEFVSMEELIGE